MAEVLEDFEFIHHRTVYPWDEWLNGQIWQLKKGVDFETEIVSMYNLIRTTAKRRKLLIRIQTTSDSIILKVTGPVQEKELENG